MSRILLLSCLWLCACGGAPELPGPLSMSYDSRGETGVLRPIQFDSCQRAADRGSAVWRCIREGTSVDSPQVHLDLVFRESFFQHRNVERRFYPFDFEVFYLSIIPIVEGRGIFANAGFEGDLFIIPQPDGTGLLTGELTEKRQGGLKVAFNTWLKLPPE